MLRRRMITESDFLSFGLVLTLTRSRLAVQSMMLDLAVSDQDSLAGPNFVKMQ